MAPLVPVVIVALGGYWLIMRLFPAKLHPPIVGGRVTSKYGPRSGVVTEANPTGAATFHGATDYGAPIGTPVYAAFAGKVLTARTWTGNRATEKSGNTITIGGDVDGVWYQADYMHLSRIDVKTGDTVTAGQTIGASGNTGNVAPIPTAANPSRGAHLHFALSIDHKLVDPETVFPSSITG